MLLNGGRRKRDSVGSSPGGLAQASFYPFEIAWAISSLFLSAVPMASDEHKTIRDLLLTRRGLIFPGVESPRPAPEGYAKAVETELATIGYALSHRLRSRLVKKSIEDLGNFYQWSLETLLAHVGGTQQHEPLFRHFPDGVPLDTSELWWKRLLCHFLQAEGQPCLHCRRTGTTHVLNPCSHVVCDQCFDGSNLSGCPICGGHVDQTSPFFKPTPERGIPKERVTFKLLDLGSDLDEEARFFFLALCARPQALSPTDREALVILLQAYKARVLDWLPTTIPLRENIAIIFGTLFKECDSSEVLPHARRFMTTATDVLRFIAVLSGTDGSLQRETVFRTLEMLDQPSRFWGRIAELLGTTPEPRRRLVQVPIRINRFKVAKLPRSLRRALLALLEGLNPVSLTEDMLRHRSLWVWVGEFLHPHEYAKRYPQVARAFQVVREKAPDGTPAPPFHTWYSRLEASVRNQNSEALLIVLSERPGEFARRLDLALRLAGESPVRNQMIEAFTHSIPKLATPMLLMLRSHLPARARRAVVRVYWPKGRVARGVSAPDMRPTLPLEVTTSLVQIIEAELLARFEAKAPFTVGIVDASLKDVMVPFNERTASRSAVSIPRGSTLPVPDGKVVRLFLHWCQPAQNGRRTDLDLSIGFYDSDWKHVGVCSYYQLRQTGKDGAVIAQSSGDFTNGPWPDGASEFVDLHRDRALAAGFRYAVMVVNAYSGMPFSQLERAFAGMMLREDLGGQIFDPRTVELKFALEGEHGIFMPLIFDLLENRLHWLDVHSPGQIALNNVANSDTSITKTCPEYLAYFASGTRPSMYDLAILQAAARCNQVFVRGERTKRFDRAQDESIQAFHSRIRGNQADVMDANVPGPEARPLLAVLQRGDLDLPDGSAAYALFRERVAPTLSAADLLS